MLNSTFGQSQNIIMMHTQKLSCIYLCSPKYTVIRKTKLILLCFLLQGVKKESSWWIIRSYPKSNRIDFYDFLSSSQNVYSLRTIFWKMAGLYIFAYNPVQWISSQTNSLQIPLRNILKNQILMWTVNDNSTVMKANMLELV